MTVKTIVRIQNGKMTVINKERIRRNRRPLPEGYQRMFECSSCVMGWSKEDRKYIVWAKGSEGELIDPVEFSYEYVAEFGEDPELVMIRQEQWEYNMYQDACEEYERISDIGAA